MGATFIVDDLELAPVLLGTYLLEVGLAEVSLGEMHGNTMDYPACYSANV